MICVLAIILVLSGFGGALTLKSEKTGFDKGKEIVLSGTCDVGKAHKIKGELGTKKIFEEQVSCFHDKFDFKYKTNYLDPSGNWKITLFTSESETDIIAQVRSVSNSAYYRVTLLSPASFTFNRAKPIFISVEITDSGNQVDEAEVVMYDAFGRRIDLKGEGKGIYDVNYSLPYNAPLGEWELIITAQKTEGEVFGGERKWLTEVKPAVLTFNVSQPTTQIFEQSDPIPFKTRITYSNGQQLTNDLVEIVELQVGKEQVPLEINSKGEFILSYNAKTSGNQIMTLYVKDFAGNEGKEKLEISITCSITCYMKSYGLLILVIALVVGVIARLFYSKTKNSLELSSLEKEKNKTIQLIKNLQKEYFERAVMPSLSYKRNLASYKARLIELEQKIKQLKTRIEAEK